MGRPKDIIDLPAWPFMRVTEAMVDRAAVAFTAALLAREEPETKDGFDPADVTSKREDPDEERDRLHFRSDLRAAIAAALEVPDGLSV